MILQIFRHIKGGNLCNMYLNFKHDELSYPSALAGRTRSLDVCAFYFFKLFYSFKGSIHIFYFLLLAMYCNYVDRCYCAPTADYFLYYTHWHCSEVLFVASKFLVYIIL